MVDFDKLEYLKCSQKTKCRYLISGQMSEGQVLSGVFLYFILALFLGLFLYFKCGTGVLQFALIGGTIACLYPFLSRIYLSEISVGLAFGPVLFSGVYYVMTGMYSKETFLLSIPTMIMTVVLLYIHTVMDYDFDLNEGKKTIANIFNSQLESLVVLKWLLIAGYASLLLLLIFDILDWQVFLVCLTIPLSLDLYKSLKIFVTNPEGLPYKKWYHFPMENMKVFYERGEAGFMFRMLQALTFALLGILQINTLTSIKTTTLFY